MNSVSVVDLERELAIAEEELLMYSAKGTSFNKDMGFENEKGGAQPGVSVFRREQDGKFSRVSKAGFGPGDDFCSVWHLFDLLAEGPAGWEPKFSY